MQSSRHTGHSTARSHPNSLQRGPGALHDRPIDYIDQISSRQQVDHSKAAMSDHEGEGGGENTVKREGGGEAISIKVKDQSGGEVRVSH